MGQIINTCPQDSKYPSGLPGVGLTDSKLLMSPPPHPHALAKTASHHHHDRGWVHTPIVCVALHALVLNTEHQCLHKLHLSKRLKLV